MRAVYTTPQFCDLSTHDACRPVVRLIMSHQEGRVRREWFGSWRRVEIFLLFLSFSFSFLDGGDWIWGSMERSGRAVCRSDSYTDARATRAVREC